MFHNNTVRTFFITLNSIRLPWQKYEIKEKLNGTQEFNSCRAVFFIAPPLRKKNISWKFLSHVITTATYSSIILRNESYLVQIQKWSLCSTLNDHSMKKKKKTNLKILIYFFTYYDNELLKSSDEFLFQCLHYIWPNFLGSLNLIEELYLDLQIDAVVAKNWKIILRFNLKVKII